MRRVPANVYLGIPLLNFVGWFTLMLLASLAWIEIARRDSARSARMAAATAAALAVAAVALSAPLNGATAALGHY